MNRESVTIRFDRERTRISPEREIVLGLLEEALPAIDPRRLVCDEAQAELADCREVLDPSPTRQVFAIALGKAAVPMARGLEEALRSDLNEGIAVCPHGSRGAVNRFRVFEARHPVPDQAGLAAAREIEGLATCARAGDRIYCLLSGGGSALFPSPPDGVCLDDLIQTTRKLLCCGASIGEINAVRRHLSTLQGGGLARRMHPARSVTWVLSDVVDAPIEAVASGPTVPDPSTFAEALGVLQRYRILRPFRPQFALI